MNEATAPPGSCAGVSEGFSQGLEGPAALVDGGTVLLPSSTLMLVVPRPTVLVQDQTQLA